MDSSNNDYDISLNQVNTTVTTENKEQEEIKPIIKHLVCSGGGINGFVFYSVFRETNLRTIWELKNIETYYRKWVHIYEAKCNGVDINIKEKHQSIYATNKNKKVVENINKLEQLRKYGYWNMEDELFFPNCYHFNSNGYEIFRGLIASSRTLNYNKNKQLIVFVGVEKQKYIEIVIKNPNKFDSQKVIVKGKGKLKNNIYNFFICIPICFRQNHIIFQEAVFELEKN